MSLYTHPITLIARSVGRKVGLNRAMRLLSKSNGYEEAFDKALLEGVRQGDVVWDIGANVGYYSAKFVDLVGQDGHVVAFEPSPENLVKLRAALAGYDNISVVDVALGATRQSLHLLQGEDDLGATSRLVEADEVGSYEVEVVAGDEIVADGKAPPPNMIKIDTEGFELDILKGLTCVLRNYSLHSVCVEVHFALLAERGLPSAPKQIEKLLDAAGFRLNWVDASHLIATRR
jgi:FkbM family methyltransferase